MSARTPRRPARALALVCALAAGAHAQAPAPAARPAAPPKASPLFATSGIADWTTPPPAGKEPTFTPPRARRLKLANGAALLVVENRSLPIASMMIVVPGAGAAMDPAGKDGLAALTADLLDEGAGGLSALAIADEIDRLGASVALAVDADAAYVSVSTLSRTLEPTLALVTRLVSAPAFDPAEFARVQGDRVTSLTLRPDRPREVAQNVLAAAIFGLATPYGRPYAGHAETVAPITVEDARRFYAERWDPARMTVVVAGDVDAGALKARLDATLGAWRSTTATRAPRPVTTPAKAPPRLLVVDRKGAAQADVRVGLLGLDRKDRRHAAFEVLRTALGEGFTSRLVQRLREQLGITYGASATQDWRLARGPFVIATAIVTPATAQGVGEILGLVKGLATTDLPADELDKVKQNIIRALPAQFETNRATASAFAELALHGLPDDWYARYAAAIRKVTAKDVRAVARAVVPADRLTIAIVGDLAVIRPGLEALGLTIADGAPYARPATAPAAAR